MIDSSWIYHQNHNKIIHQGLFKKIINNFLVVSIFIIIAFGFSYLIINAQSVTKIVKFQINSTMSPYYDKIENQINLTAQANFNNISYDNLIIPKIDLKESINWRVSELDFTTQLTKGIIHAKSSNLPSDGSGNILLIGYSSLPFWQNQGGSTVFSLLNKLSLGDRINIRYQDNYYVYQVKNKLISNSELIDLNNPSDKQLLTLMTYWPIGVNSHKLFVVSELISSSSNK
ncbi:MAG: hypothetical protein ACD_58C00037G0008 [uncultured bacterium]|nr:MAG: hypothetical protein ACD_58C00037G0008 [uncultured bacterium]